MGHPLLLKMSLFSKTNTSREQHLQSLTPLCEVDWLGEFAILGGQGCYKRKLKKGKDCQTSVAQRLSI